MVGVAKGSFAEVSNKPDFPAQERTTLRRWADEGTVQQYLRPITANGLMGVHHAWGRCAGYFHHPR